MVNEAALTPTEHLEVILEAAAGLHKAAKRNRHLYEVLEALLSV
jgi:hypothetical protein